MRLHKSVIEAATVCDPDYLSKEAREARARRALAAQAKPEAIPDGAVWVAINEWLSHASDYERIFDSMKAALSAALMRMSKEGGGRGGVMRVPLHVREGSASEWGHWFAWRPVRSEQNYWVWLRRTYKRTFYPPAWFVPPAPSKWTEYSDIKKSFWEQRQEAADDQHG